MYAATSAAALEFMRKAGMTYEARVQTVGQLHRAGVPVVSGSDGGVSPSRRHGVLPEAVIHLVEGALASATSLAAKACGVDDRKGRLAADLDADLLLVDGDPLADIAALRNLEATSARTALQLSSTNAGPTGMQRSTPSPRGSGDSGSPQASAGAIQ